MGLIADGLLFLTALTTGFYCLVLASRLRRFARADDGIGQQIQALSAAVDETRGALGQTQARLEEMRRDAQLSGERMTREAARAKRVADELSAAAAEGERTLDALYRAEKRISADPARDAEAGAREGDGLRDLAAAGAVVEAVELTEAASYEPSRSGAPVGAPQRAATASPAWSGGDVLRVERMVL